MILSIDIGGTEAKYAFVDGSYRICAKYSTSTSFDEYETPVIDTVVRGAKEFTGQYPIDFDAVGVSAAGQIDTRTGVVIGTNGMIKGYEGTRIADALKSALDKPVYVLNDANAAALGECAAGGAIGVRNCVMVTLGTGVGGGIVIDGRVYGGARGIAGEIGLLPMYPGTVPPGGGRNGVFEGFASTKALVRIAERELNETELTGRVICDRVKNGDSAMKRVMEGWLDDVAFGLIGLVHIFNPEMLLIGGGISAQEELVTGPLRDRVLTGAMPRFAENLRVERATLGNDAGVIGAAVYAAQRIDE